MDAEGWRAVVTSIMFLLFFAGLVVTYQAIVGKELGLFKPVWGQKPNPNDPGPVHPADQHRWERTGIGLGMIAGAVVLALVVIA